GAFTPGRKNARHSRDGGYFARRSQTPRARHERRRSSFHDQAGTGRAVHCGRSQADWRGSGHDGGRSRAGRAMTTRNMTYVGKKTRGLIVDDSAFMRKVPTTMCASDPQLEVCGEARDGHDAVTQTEALKPDVVSMDINMPHMDGLQATEIIMSSNPRPILVVSSESQEGAAVTLKALQLGAIDFVSKPSGGVDLDLSSVRDEICRKLKIAAK